ncbi:hypothetical protein HPB51_012359 [Rhipicephalus microplus]|uniref:Tick transposon n=1 Tax=Rhipicephalus microplus TaxID=6941 RepID=A0A9J6DGE3_RHIMP|nr:hypothetical protein HPB51_012359 [Rhipicephalus microplus]
MRQLLGVHARQDGQLPLLRELFLQRLPQSVRVVLAGSNETSLDRLAQLADRITEYSTPTFAPIAAARTHEQPDRLSRLEEKLQHLTETMQKLVLSGAPQQDEQRRNRSPSRHPSSSQRSHARDTQDGCDVGKPQVHQVLLSRVQQVQAASLETIFEVDGNFPGVPRALSAQAVAIRCQCVPPPSRCRHPRSPARQWLKRSTTWPVACADGQPRTLVFLIRQWLQAVGRSMKTPGASGWASCLSTIGWLPRETKWSGIARKLASVQATSSFRSVICDVLFNWELLNHLLCLRRSKQGMQTLMS